MAPAPTKSAATKKEEGSPPGGGVPGQGQVINLALLEVPQLQQLKSQVEQELNFYQEAIVQLKDVQMKMVESETCLKMIDPKRTEMLVPVTGSMFVRGELIEADKVLVDIGTGYYVEKTMEDAIDYFQRKVVFLTTQVEKVQAVGRDKSNIRNAIIEVMDIKVNQIRMSQAQAGGQQKPAVKA